MQGVGSLNETARNMSRGPRGIAGYQQFADGGPVYMQEGGEPVEEERLSRNADIASRYKLNSEDSGLRNLYKKIPTNMRLLIENLIGDTSTITEDDFTNNELIEIISAIEKQKAVNAEEEQILKEEGADNKKFVTKGTSTEEALDSYEETRGKTSINPYNKFTTFTGLPNTMVDNNYRDSLIRSFGDPEYNVATSLGRYNAYDTDEGYNIIDEYNFNPEMRNINSGGILKALRRSPELAGEYLSNLFKTSPRDVDINLQRANATNQ